MSAMLFVSTFYEINSIFKNHIYFFILNSYKPLSVELFIWFYAYTELKLHERFIVIT